MRSRLLHEPVRLAGASLLRLQSDERLAALARDGHEPAFAAIVHRYQGPLLRYCAGIVGPARAEDAVQQAFINAHDALPRTSEVRHLKSWLHRIAHNVSLNTLRAARDEVPLDAGQVALDPRPDDAYERAERLRVTLQAVRDLPERQRAALLLRELEGRSHDEIALALGTTAGGARQHLLRARAAVRHAATAITPYPLMARLADAVADPSAARVAEAIAGAGAGATIVKLTAGLAATGALVGGVVGTNAVVQRDPSPPAAATQTRMVKPRANAAATTQAVPAAGTSGTSRLAYDATTSSGTTGGAHRRAQGGDDAGRGSGRRHGSRAGTGDDHSGSGDDGRDHRSSDDSRRGTSGSGSDDRRESDRSGSRQPSGSDDTPETDRSGSGSSSAAPETEQPSSGSSGSESSDTSGSGTSGSGTSGGGDDPPEPTQPREATTTHGDSGPD